MAIRTSKNADPDLRAVNVAPPLLSREDGPPVEIVNPEGDASILLICEHASNRIPTSLRNLGLDTETKESHVAFDPGAEPVARLMAERLDAPLILQRFSRLVYDCNRPPDAESAMPEQSEVFGIPGNQDLSAADRIARTGALYVPFHQTITDHLDRAAAAGRFPAIVTIHSFTPVFHGKKRSVQLGLLHDTDRRLADAMLDLEAEPDIPEARRNEPYGPEDGVTHTLQRHALPRNLLNVMIEIKNNLIQDPAGQAGFGTGLARMVSLALDRLGNSEVMKERRAGR